MNTLPLFSLRRLSLNPDYQSYSLFQKLFFSRRSCPPIPVLSLMGRPKLPTAPESSSSSPQETQVPDFSPTDFSTISNVLKNPRDVSELVSALDRTSIVPDSGLIHALFDHFGSSPKLLHILFRWAQSKPEFQSSATLFDKMINILGKAKQFDTAWSLILDQIERNEESNLVSGDTFIVLIRRYARAGMAEAAIRTLEFASSSDSTLKSGEEVRLLEILLDSLCKEGQVRTASEYFYKKKLSDPSWVPSVRVYNILLNGWFRSRNLKKAEKLWLEMKKDNIKPTVVTYGTLIEGYCRMRRVEIAIELLDELKRDNIEPNLIVYNPIIDALGEGRRFTEAFGMIERFWVCESGPNVSTYNSLVKGFCKAGDLTGASKILKMMTNKNILPITTTYNYFFRYFSKYKKIDEGMNLYTKLIDSGYNPDQLTYQLLLKMLCEDQKLDLAIQVGKEMRARGFDMDLATSTMLIHLLLKMNRFEEAVAVFEDMIRKGIVPQYITFRIMNETLRKRGMIGMARKLCDLMSSVPHSKQLPNTYSEEEDGSSRKRTSILRKAEAMSDMLKVSKNPRVLVKHRAPEKSLRIATQIMEDVNRRKRENLTAKSNAGM